MTMEGNWVGIGGLPIVAFKLTIDTLHNRKLTIDNRQSEIDNRQSTIPNPYCFTGSTNTSADSRCALNGMSIPLVVKSLPLTFICTPVSTSVTRYIPLDLSFGKVTC